MANTDIKTIHSPSQLFPHNCCVDMDQDLLLSCIVSGLCIDSYEFVIKNPVDNSVVFDSGNSVNVKNTDSNMKYGGATYKGVATAGTWTTSVNKIVDSSDANIQYFGTGWARITSNAGYYDNTVNNSSVTCDYLQYSFTGTGINCYFTKGKDKGIFDVLVDGDDNGNVDTYISNGTSSGGNNFKVNAYSITGLTYGTHVIKINITGNFQSGATAKIEFDYFQVLNTNGSKNTFYKNDYVQYSFESNGIEVFMDQTPDSGTMDVYIDNVIQGDSVDLYSATYDMNVQVYTNMNLTYGTHVIKLINSGSKNTQSSNNFMCFESITVTNKTSLNPVVYDKHVWSVLLLGGTVTLKGALKWQLTYWNSSNDGENRSSSEFLFTNMTVPTSLLNIFDTDVLTSKSFTFLDTYTQEDNIPIKRYNYSLSSIAYDVDCGYFGQSVSSSGTLLDCGNMSSKVDGYYIDCGMF